MKNTSAIRDLHLGFMELDESDKMPHLNDDVENAVKS